MKIEEIDCKPNTEKYHQEQQTIAFAAHEQKENVSDGSLSMLAAENAAAEAAAPTTTTAALLPPPPTTNEMTDERNNNNNSTSNSNKKKKSYDNDHIITEAAKIVLKNGLNGATATTATAATALLTAAAAAAAVSVIKLPPPPPPLPTHANFALYGAYPGMVAAPAAPFGFSINNGNSTSNDNLVTDAALDPHQHHLVPTSVSIFTTTNAAILSTAKVDEMSAATLPQTIKVQSSSECLNLGTSKPSSCGISDGRAGGGGGGESKVDNVGVIDYTLGPKNNNKNNCNSHHSDIGRHPISASNEMPRGQSYGGRLQFFKDGKFILELARSKDNEKGGWVSVPRKIFRTPSSATSSTITPTSNTSATYPKNESSTSLSFSDDNSSIQSSPWQRDHCWKQATPRCGISKEMSLLYQRPNKFILSSVGLKISRRKRRRPFDNSFPSSLENIFMTLEPMENGIKSNIAGHRIGIEVKSSSANNSEDDTCSSSSTGTLTGADCTDNNIINQTRTHTPKSSSRSMSAELVMEEHENNASEEILKDDAKRVAEMTNGDQAIPAKESSSKGMNTSEDENNDDTTMSLSVAEVKDESTKETVNGDVKIESDFVAPSPLIKDSDQVRKNEDKCRAGKGEKRLKKLKTRAKLITIIQKLIDRIPTAGLLYLSRTLQPMIGGNCSTASIPNSSNSSASKMSPSSTSASSPASAASRLVELQYHQQHVSPRKRILREFEKVSLEDTGTIVAGAKRSRAKGNSANISKSSSSSQRMQSTSCILPTSTSMTTVTTANGCFNKNVSKPMTCIPSTNSTPTRLYSSYSIHSLLSGGGGNSSSLNSTTVPNPPTSTSMGKRASEYVNNFSNMNYQQQHSLQLANNYTDPSYLRAMLASPKSPESSCGGASGSVYVGNAGGGKSPSNFSSKKRSPPYSSPLYDNHSRSPNIPTHPNSDYNGQHSPNAASLEPNYKMRFSTTEQNSAATQSNHVHQQQSFYSPYMMSPKYVAAPQASISPNSMTTANTARSPHRTPAFNAHIPTSNTSSTVATNCIPTRELSPPRSATAPPRDSTPRTVPKKTASIRRQFASPSIAVSPTERHDDQQQQDRKTPLNTSVAGTTVATSTPHHHQQHSFQTILSNPHHIPGPSPLAASSLHYYMYPPNAGSSSPNAIGSPAISSASAAVQAAALAAAYIPSVVPPSYYHPYISTLAALRQNPLWMHHYPGATTPLLPLHNTASSSQSSSGSFHSFPYNGVGAAATVAAAAAAAAAFGGGGGGGPIPPSHLAQVGLAHQMALPSAMAHHAAVANAFIGGPTHSPRLTDEICARTKAGAKQVTPTSIYSSSIKDEHSSDVPLNLSKH